MAKESLNLSVERASIERARRYSELHGTSISRLVDQFLGALPLGEPADGDLPPIVRRLAGILREDVTMEDYRRHLEEKHGR